MLSKIESGINFNGPGALLLCLLSEGGVLHPVLVRRGSSIKSWWGKVPYTDLAEVSPIRLDGGTPLSELNTCYVVGSMSFAFTREDFCLLSYQ